VSVHAACLPSANVLHSSLKLHSLNHNQYTPPLDMSTSFRACDSSGARTASAPHAHGTYRLELGIASPAVTVSALTSH
jgi:hypothetical protein